MTRIYIETVGCSLNFADSEQMAGLLKQAKFEIVSNIEEADLIIFNTCTVKTPTENAFFKRLEEVETTNPYKMVLIAGCIAQASPEKLKKYALIGTKQIHRIVEAVEELINENKIKMIKTNEVPPLNLSRIRRNPVIYTIPISRGCLGACTFCKTKAARGNLVSYPIAEIKKEAETAISSKAEEIWLSSQDTGCYGFDINTNLAQLLEELVNLPGRFKIRVGMMNPEHLIKIKEEFMEIFVHKKIFKFIHLPLQSGSNEILKAMKRTYTTEQYKNLVRELREKFPRLTLSTDILVGFPGETEEQHWETLNLIRELSPEVVNISKFWSRPNTPAAKMKQVPSEVIKHRSKVISDICQNISKLQNERWLGWEGEIIIDEKSREGGQWIGRNNSYKQVLVNGNFKLGSIVMVKITKSSNYDLRGEVID